MLEKRHNIFQQATQLVSLDCSSIIGENFTMCHNTSESLKQSLLNLKTVLPTFTSQFSLFKEEMIQTTYFVINKLMSVIKTKSTSISRLQEELQKAQCLNNGTKKQVIQLKEMISEFMESYKREMQQKEKEISQKQNEVYEIKNVLRQNFNSPRNLCKNCGQKISNDPTNLIADTTKKNQEQTEQNSSYELKLDNFFRNLNKSQEILIEMSESIVCNTEQLNKRKSLQIIQEEGSEVNSLTDYLQSQRCSQKEGTSKSMSEIIRSVRSNEEKDNNYGSEEIYTGKRSLLQDKAKSGNQCVVHSAHNLSDCDKTVKDCQSPLGKINFFQNLQNKTFQDTFSSRITNKNYQNNENPKPDAQRQRRCSQVLVAQKASYDGFKIQRKSQQRVVLANKLIENEGIPFHKKSYDMKEQISLKAQLQQISKSSSCSELNHFGDSQKININLPKKLQIPKNMNFVKNNTSLKQPRQERLKTEPSPRNSKYRLEKENIQIQYQSKPIEMGRKIFARKKMIMTHAKASTSRIDSKKLVKEEPRQSIPQTKDQQSVRKKDSFIEIKFIQSPQKEPSKSTHLIKPSVATIFSSCIPKENFPRNNTYMEYSSTSSNISAINESVVKTHQLYHSTDKYQSESTPKNNVHRMTMTPGKPQSKNLDRKSMSKSKQKLKVTSKSTNQDTGLSSSHHSTTTKQRFLTQLNQQNYFSSNNNPHNQSISKLRNKNLAVHIGGISTHNKIHLKQNLIEIKTALTQYNLDRVMTSLKEVYFDCQMENGLKEGYGKVVYDNGIIYQGLLEAGKRQGEAKLVLNGIDIYEGSFANDQIEGQGYLKFFKYFANSSCLCPKVLQNASYYGRFANNQLDGMGTLFLSQKEKIVTKFSKGIPYGELTFYTENDIEFGHWPNE